MLEIKFLTLCFVGWKRSNLKTNKDDKNSPEKFAMTKLWTLRIPVILKNRNSVHFHLSSVMELSSTTVLSKTLISGFEIFISSTCAFYVLAAPFKQT